MMKVNGSQRAELGSTSLLLSFSSHIALPGNPNIEAISKESVLKALKDATRQTKTKGGYSKRDHSFELLAPP